ncbi:MAG: DUF262 domain-containing protein [Vampirovibrionales bacterium]
MVEEHTDKYIHSPSFQRRKTRWENFKKVRLIDSLFRGIPIGNFLMFEREDEAKQNFYVIDGLQRLTTIVEYLENNFSLKGSEIENSSWYGKTYSELSEEDKTHLKRSTLSVTFVRVFGVKEMEKVARLIFNRINVASTPLSLSEQYFSLYPSDFLDQVRKLADKEFVFKQLFNLNNKHKKYLIFEHLDYLVRAMALAEEFENYSTPVKTFVGNYLAKQQKSKKTVSNYELLLKDLAQWGTDSTVVRFQKNGISKKATPIYTLFVYLLAFYFKNPSLQTEEKARMLFSSEFKQKAYAHLYSLSGAAGASTTDKKTVLLFFQWLEKEIDTCLPK